VIILRSSLIVFHFAGKMLATAKLLGVHGFCFDSRHQEFYSACGCKTNIKVVTVCRLVFEHGLPFDRVIHLSSNEKASALLDAALQRTSVDLSSAEDVDGATAVHVSCLWFAIYILYCSDFFCCGRCLPILQSVVLLSLR
jgi:hypothetical protein